MENIYSDFRTNYEEKPDFTINFYEKNSVYLNNVKQFKNKDDLKLYIEIIGKYAEAVYKKGRYNNAVDFIDKQQLFIDCEITRLNADDVKNVWYYDLYFVKGMASNRLKDYRTATLIFKTLVQIDAQNDMFKNWLTHSQYGLRLWLVRTINIVCFGLVMTEIIFKSQISNQDVRQIMLTVGVLGLLSNLVYERYVEGNFRKKTRSE